MTTSAVWVHQDVYQQLETWRDLRRKVEWTLLQLAVSGGDNLIVKGFTGSQISWRRTPVQGNHFYLWWVPAAVSAPNGFKADGSASSILVRAVLHHDDEAQAVGMVDDYAPAHISALDPRYDDQRDVASPPFKNVDLRIVAGSPGSGKTVALLFSAIKSVERGSLQGQSHDQTVLYVTYTSGLARQARGYLETYGIGDRVETVTFDELVGRILGTESDLSAYRRDRAARTKLMRWLESQPDHATGAWRAHPDLLWAEFRSYLLGMALPFPWKREGLGEVSASGQILSLDDYVDVRRQSLRGHGTDLDDEVLETAHHLAQNAIEEDEFFEEQFRARSALSRLTEQDDDASWLEAFDTIVVDEIQDLTLLQIAAIVEAGRLAAAGDRQIPFLFVAAGDESQIVQPSGFDWGQTKDLLSQRLLEYPRDFPLRSQRRSPRRLGQLIKDSWALYSNLPKGLYPKADAESGDSDPAEEGVLLRWGVGAEFDWEKLFSELGSHPDAALVDLDGSALAMVPDLSEDTQGPARSQVYEPRQIKGLERKLVLIHGLDTALGKVRNLTLDYDKGSDLLPALEARNTIDNVRVALSRSTHMIVVIERDSGQIVENLAMEDASVLSWEALQEKLREVDQDLSAFDKIHVFLGNADESLQRDDYDRAKQQNLQAEQLLTQVADPYLSSRVHEQKEKINRALTRQRLITSLEEAQKLRDAEKLREAYTAWAEARQLSAQVADPGLDKDVDAFWQGRDRELNQIASESWKDAREKTTQEQWAEAGHAFEVAASIRRYQERDSEAKALECLAQRYQDLPSVVEGADHARRLVGLTSRYVDCLVETDTTGSESARRIADEWLAEAASELSGQPGVFLLWAKVGSRVAEWGGAELAEHHPDFAREAVQAAEALRRLGESSDAVALLNLAGKEIPQELNEFEDVLRTLEDVDQRAIGRGWYPAERKRLGQRFAATAELLSSD